MERMSVRSFLETVRKGKPSKYRNKRVQYQGMVFDSQHEANRYAELLMLERAGEISELKRQVKYQFTAGPYQMPVLHKGGRPVTYAADFVYRDRRGFRVVEDAKGYPTDEYKLKWALMRACHGIEVQET